MFEPIPEDSEIEEQTQRPLLSRTRVAVGAVVLILVAFSAYSIHQHGLAIRAMEQNAATTASLKNANAQIEQLTAKLNDLSGPKPQSLESPAPSGGVAVQKPKSSTPKLHHSTSHPAAPDDYAPRWNKVQSQRGQASALISGPAARDDRRWSKVQSQLDEQGRAIASTKQDLSNTRTELQGSIARTHGELVVLQRKGDRLYYEFDIQKTKQFSHAGNMSIKLRKADVKHQYANLDLLINDSRLTKRYVNIYEPTIFYTRDDDQGVQLVINRITKDHIHGYVSQPKYSRADLSSMQAGR